MAEQRLEITTSETEKEVIGQHSGTLLPEFNTEVYGLGEAKIVQYLENNHIIEAPKEKNQEMDKDI